MTTTLLTALVLLAIAAQLGIWAVLALRRRRREATAAVQPPTAPAPSVPPARGWSGLRTLRVQRKVVEDPAGSTCSFYLAPDDGGALPPFEPGQYLTLELAIPAGDGGTRPVTRCYSLSDRPRPDYYRITVKRVPAPADRLDLPPGLVSNYLHDHVREGERLQARAPAGPFHLADRGGAPIALVGGGIGITPMLSIVNTLLHEGSRRDIWLFYGVRNGADHAMKHDLEALAGVHPNLHLHVCYSRPREEDTPGADYRHAGRVDVERLRLTLPRTVETFYVCGPPALMASLVPALEAWGVAPEHIHYEAFGPASLQRRTPPPSTAPAADARVTFSRSGKRLDWEPSAGTLLEFAEAHGIPVESGCRAGLCGGCQTAVEAGEVEYLQPPEAELEAGHCLLCISRPKGDLTLNA